MKRLGFNIILLGDNASGKETQANILKKRYALKFVASGVFSRNLLKAKSKEGERARATVAKGKPLPTRLMQDFLAREIKNKPKNKDLLFLGAGRLKPEAQLIKKMLAKRGEDFVVLYLTLPEKEIYKRSLLRRKSNIKAIYKVLDTEKIIKQRIKYYKNQVSKAVKYWDSLGKLTKINGNQPIPKVTKDILLVIENYKNKL